LTRATETQSHGDHIFISVTPRLRGLFGLWAPVVLYMAAIFCVSSLPQVPIPPGADKPWHAIAYLGLAVVVVRAVAGGLPRRVDRRIASLAIAMAVGYAVTDEVHQMFVPGRTADVADLIADTAGALAGTAACWAWGIIAQTSRDEL
jgi:VanZ family protein